MTPRPLIGITMRLETATRRFYLARHYSEAVQASGGVPLHIPLIVDERYLASVAERIDGLLLPGSDSDTDPYAYGEEPRPRLGRVVPERDATDGFLLIEAERRAMPVFGICYGMQALNVARGGSLHQDIETEVGSPLKHEQGEPWDNNTHVLREIPSDSIIAELGARDGETKVNSHHHQAVKALGRDLRVTARTSDGIVECVEDTRQDRFVIGVQWHPELSWNWDVFSKALFDRFVAECSSKF